MPRLSAGPALVICLTALFALPQMAGGYRLTKWGLLGLGLATLALGLLVRPRPHGQLRFVPWLAWVPSAAFVAAAVLLPLAASSFAAAHWPLALVLLTGLGFFFVTSVALHEAADPACARRSSVLLLTATGALCAVLVLLQAAGLSWMTEGVPDGLEFRAPGTFGNPNWAAAFLAPLVPLSLALGATAAGARERRLHQGLAALLAIAVAATLSKDGAATLVAGVLSYLLLDRGAPRRRRVALLSVGFAGAVGIWIAAWQLDWLQSAPWLRGRWFVWQAALLLACHHPLTGLGLGGFLPAYGEAARELQRAHPDLFMPLSVLDVAHNDVLQFAAEGGFLTAAGFLAVVASALLLSWREGSPLTRGVGAAIAALFVNGLADPPLRMPVTFALFFFLLGWLAAAASQSEEPGEGRPDAAGAKNERNTAKADRAAHSTTEANPTAHSAAQYNVTASVARHVLLIRFLLIASFALGAVQGVRYLAGNLYWTWGRDALDREGPIEPTIQHYEQARFFLPEHGRIALEHARALARAGKLDEALLASKAASALRFDWDDELFRADVRAHQLKPDEVVQMWQDLSARYPMLLTPHLRLGALYAQAGNVAAAIRQYEAVLARPQPTRAGASARAQATSALRRLRGEEPAEQRPPRKRPSERPSKLRRPGDAR